MNEAAPLLWLLTDNKPGHRNQLRGLAGRLRALTGARTHWLQAGDFPVSRLAALLGLAPPLPDAPPAPDLIIAAGSHCHRLLLALRRKAPTVVLMKPGFPRHWVSAVILPEHDRVKAGKRTLVTHGALNAITPLARLTDRPVGLILIGGPSKHFEWDEHSVLEQVTTLTASYPAWHWTVSDSRRTPASLQAALQKLASPRVTVRVAAATHEDWLAHQLAASRAVWVSPDSASMVWEAITSGVPTGVLDLPARQNSRVATGLRDAVARGYALPWHRHAEVMSSPPPARPGLWEADRAARWLIRTLPQAFCSGKRVS